MRTINALRAFLSNSVSGEIRASLYSTTSTLLSSSPSSSDTPSHSSSNSRSSLSSSSRSSSEPVFSADREVGRSRGSNCASKYLRKTSCALSAGGGGEGLESVDRDATAVSLFRLPIMVSRNFRLQTRLDANEVYRCSKVFFGQSSRSRAISNSPISR